MKKSSVVLLTFLSITTIVSGILLGKMLYELNVSHDGEFQGKYDLVLHDEGNDSRACTYDFGSAISGEKVRYQFRIFNAGNNALDVINVKTTCSCTVAENIPKEIPPGCVAVFPVTMTLKEMGGVATVFASVTFKNAKPMDLAIQGRVIRDNPGKIDLGSIPSGIIDAHTFVLRSTDGKQLQVESIDYDKNVLDVTWKPSSQNSAVIEVCVSLLKDIPTGFFETELVATTNDPNRPRKATRVMGTILGPVSTKPERILFGGRDSRDGQATLAVLATYGGTIRIVDVQVPEGDAKVVAEWPRESMEEKAEIKLRLESTPKGSVWKDEITIIAELNGESATYSLSLPCFAMGDGK